MHIDYTGESTLTLTGPHELVAAAVGFIGDGHDLAARLNIPTEHPVIVSVTQTSPDHTTPCYEILTDGAPPGAAITALSTRYGPVTCTLQYTFDDDYGANTMTQVFRDGVLLCEVEQAEESDCEVCGLPGFAADMIRIDGWGYSDAYFHTDCMTTTATVSVTGSNGQALDAVREAVAGNDLGDYLPDDPDDIVEALLGENDPGGYASAPDFNGAQFPVCVVSAEPGSLTLIYPTIVCDRGGALVGLSSEHPNTAFTVTVPQPDGTTRQTTLVGGKSVQP